MLAGSGVLEVGIFGSRVKEVVVWDLEMEGRSRRRW